MPEIRFEISLQAFFFLCRITKWTIPALFVPPESWLRPARVSLFKNTLSGWSFPDPNSNSTAYGICRWTKL
ncbi:hypothetical protein Pla110_36300 [Polystyrenella longa]|uniref:Uncharacterized protein n=1 Tax=Polystyrenella longa TaxID=2528007 RepID=A0A518CRM6_9PLAN|nr:hypothetical protein Pla110_36300 [Polystyrenella longa]